MYVHVHLLLSMISSIKLLPSFVWTNDPSPPGTVGRLGRQPPWVSPAKSLRELWKPRGRWWRWRWWKWRWGWLHPEGVCSEGGLNGGIEMVLSLNLQFYRSSVIFRMFTLHEKWLNRIRIRVPMIPLAHVSNQDSTCNTLQQHVQSTLT